MSDGKRFPRSDIPASLICPQCNDGPPRSFGNELGFRQHMKAKHGVLYELAAASERKGMSVEELRLLPDTSELVKLKPWMAFAIARHEVYGETWAEVAKQMGRSAGTLAAAAGSPAGQAFRSQLQDILTTPHSVVKMLMESATLERYMDWLLALEWAKAARDYKAVHTMMKDLGLAPVAAEVDRDRGPSTIVVNLSSSDLDGPSRARTEIKDARAHAQDAVEGEFTVEY